MSKRGNLVSFNVSGCEGVDEQLKEWLESKVSFCRHVSEGLVESRRSYGSASWIVVTAHTRNWQYTCPKRLLTRIHFGYTARHGSGQH